MKVRRFKVFFNGNQLFDFILNKKGDTISTVFEIISTKINCPKCNDNTLIIRVEDTPSIDSFCITPNCKHTIEVKSILAEGEQEDAFIGKPFPINMGSVNTYKEARKRNKSLMVFWYNYITKSEDYYEVIIRNVLMFDMDKFNETNCEKNIVLQRKKSTMRKRMKFTIFPELSSFIQLFFNDFVNIVSIFSKRQFEAHVKYLINKRMKSHKNDFFNKKININKNYNDLKYFQRSK